MATIQDALMHICSVTTKAIDTWIANNDETSIREAVLIELEKQKKEIVLKLLGFDTSWGRLEVDHCNGRAGESSAGDYLKKVSKDAVNEFLATVEMPKLTKDEVKSLQDTYRKRLYTELVQQLQIAATQDAKELSQKIIKEVLPDANPIEQYTQLLTLIKG